MRFKLDENLPASAAAILASAGHDVDTVPGEGLTAAPGLAWAVAVGYSVRAWIDGKEKVYGSIP
jgi:Domain of unknown function (DUF5615)